MCYQNKKFKKRKNKRRKKVVAKNINNKIDRLEKI